MLTFSLGRQRVRILLAVARPSTSQVLARQLEVTSGGVSHHLVRLRKAGLVEVRHEGRLRFYSLSEKGKAVLALFT